MKACVRNVCLVVVVLLSASVAACGRRVHEKSLVLQFSDRHAVPSFARSQAGLAFTGPAYGTFSGEGLLDCVEWEGAFSNGRPHGDFKLYSGCDVLQSTVSFSHGVKLKNT